MAAAAQLLYCHVSANVSYLRSKTLQWNYQRQNAVHSLCMVAKRGCYPTVPHKSQPEYLQQYNLLVSVKIWNNEELYRLHKGTGPGDVHVC